MIMPGISHQDNEFATHTKARPIEMSSFLLFGDDTEVVIDPILLSTSLALTLRVKRADIQQISAFVVNTFAQISLFTEVYSIRAAKAAAMFDNRILFSFERPEMRRVCDLYTSGPCVAVGSVGSSTYDLVV